MFRYKMNKAVCQKEQTELTVVYQRFPFLSTVSKNTVTISDTVIYQNGTKNCINNDLV